MIRMRFRVSKIYLLCCVAGFALVCTVLPAAIQLSQWVTSFSALIHANTISERDLPLGYQEALNVSLAPSLRGEPCCEHALWNITKHDRSLELIPRIIHQTWKTTKLPDDFPDWKDAHRLCLNIHPPENGWRHILWTDESAREFLVLHYPGVLDVYDAFPEPIQRVDAMRYYILHHHGGIYIDLDIGCARSLESLLPFAAFFPATDPIGVSNDLMGARKAHPFMNLLGDEILAQNSLRGVRRRKSAWRRIVGLMNSSYVTVFFTTGPMFVNIQLRDYYQSLMSHSRSKVKSNSKSATKLGVGSESDMSDFERKRDPDGVVILPKRFYSATLSSYFMHFPGSSWHASDARITVFMLHVAPYIVLLVCAIGTIYLCLRFMSRRRRQRRRQHNMRPGGSKKKYRRGSEAQFVRGGGTRYERDAIAGTDNQEAGTYPLTSMTRSASSTSTSSSYTSNDEEQRYGKKAG